ncbi:MAG: YdeI/OmpD-associated family protein [Myxococcota bacterium]
MAWIAVPCQWFLVSASMPPERYRFTTTVDIYDFGRMQYTVAYVPGEIAAALPLSRYPRLRIDGRVGGVPFHGALQPAGGVWYLILSKRLLKDAGLVLGDEVGISFVIADQDAVDVPPDLEEAIQQRHDLREVWESLTPGRRRSFSHRVDSAVRLETRERRILEVIDAIMDERG